MQMEKHIPKTETRFDDMAGAVSLNFRDSIDFATFAREVAGVDTDKYEPVSLRVFLHKDILVTVYAVDKEKVEAHRARTGRVLVKKFKVEVAPADLLSYFKQVDCTVVNGEYDVEDFEVIN